MFYLPLTSNQLLSLCLGSIGLLIAIVLAFRVIEGRQAGRYFRAWLASGREIVRLPASLQGKMIGCQGVFTVARPRRWHRVMLALQGSEKALNFDIYTCREQRQRQHYTLQLSDERGEALYHVEQESIYPFIEPLIGWTRGGHDRLRGDQTLSANFQGEVPILDFLPEWPGVYRLDFQVRARVSLTEAGALMKSDSKYQSEIERLVVYVREDVQPWEGEDRAPVAGAPAWISQRLRGRLGPLPRIDLMRRGT